MNVTMITGRLGRDPELRHSGDGTPWVTFSVAEGRRKEEPIWFECKAFGRMAEVIGQYGAKGRLVLVLGQMVQENFETKEGENRQAWRLVASSLEFLDPRRESAEDSVALEGGALQEAPF